MLNSPGALATVPALPCCEQLATPGTSRLRSLGVQSQPPRHLPSCIQCQNILHAHIRKHNKHRPLHTLTHTSTGTHKLIFVNKDLLTRLLQIYLSISWSHHCQYLMSCYCIYNLVLLLSLIPSLLQPPFISLPFHYLPPVRSSPVQPHLQLNLKKNTLHILMNQLINRIYVTDRA